MRNLILVLSVLAIVASIPSAEAGLSTTPRQTSASSDNPVGETSQQTEDQLRLKKAKRREVQRKLAKLGFGAKVNGKFDDTTHDAIARWQESRGYPKTGFLDAEQYKTLSSENVASTDTGADRSSHSRGGHRARSSRGIGGPIGVIGGAVAGIFHGL